jgi:hypothetical protein
MSEPEALRWFGRMAGAMFIAGALLPIPSTLLLEPRPPLASYSLTLVVLLTGLACLALPWDRASRHWLHAIGALATIQTAVTVALFDPSFAVLYLVIAVFVAYGFGRPRSVFPQIALISIAILAPLAYDPGDARETLQIALLLLPSIWMLAGGVVFLRTQVDTRERTYRQFAEQALKLSERIAGAPAVSPPPARSLARREPVAEPRGIGRRWRLALAALAAILAVPLGFAGLAAAGVTLPSVVVDPFESVGIELPNQTVEAVVPTAAAAGASVDDVERIADTPRTADGGRESSSGRASDSRKRGRRADPSAAAGGAPDATGSTAPTVAGNSAGSVPAAPAPGAGNGVTGVAPAPDAPSVAAPDRGSILQDAINDVGSILEQPLLDVAGDRSRD